MNYIDIDGNSLREKFGSHFNIGFEASIRQDNLKVLNEKFDGNIISKVLSDNLVFQYINYFPNCAFPVNEALGASDKERMILVEQPESIIQSALIVNNIVNSSYENEGEALKALALITAQVLEKVKSSCNNFLDRKNFSDILGLNYKEKKEVRKFLESLEPKLNMENVPVNYTTTRKIPENFPNKNDDFWIVNSSIQNPYIEKLKVSEIKLYDINNAYSKQSMPFTIYLKSVSSEKEFTMTKDNFDRSNGTDFSVGMAGYTLFKDKEKGEEYLNSVLNKYSATIEKAKEQITNDTTPKFSR